MANVTKFRRDKSHARVDRDSRQIVEIVHSEAEKAIELAVSGMHSHYARMSWSKLRGNTPIDRK